MSIDSKKLYAGDTWSWTETLPDFPASEYTAKIILKRNNAAAIIITASIVDDVFNFSYSSANTSAIPAGKYYYQYVAVKSGLDYYSASGYIEIYANILTTASDMRGQWQQIHDNLLAVYNTMIADGKVEASVTMNGRSVTYDRANLIKEIQNAEMKAREENGEGGFESFAITFQRR